MLKSIAEFSKTIKKYSYYPMIIGFVGLATAAAYDGSRALLGLLLAAVCAIPTNRSGAIMPTALNPTAKKPACSSTAK